MGFLSVVYFSFVAVASSVSSGIIRALPPYRLVNAGLCEYNKKKNSFKNEVSYTSPDNSARLNDIHWSSLSPTSRILLCSSIGSLFLARTDLTYLDKSSSPSLTVVILMTLRLVVSKGAN